MSENIDPSSRLPHLMADESTAATDQHGAWQSTSANTSTEPNISSIQDDGDGQADDDDGGSAPMDLSNGNDTEGEETPEETLVRLDQTGDVHTEAIKTLRERINDLGIQVMAELRDHRTLVQMANDHVDNTHAQAQYRHQADVNTIEERLAALRETRDEHTTLLEGLARTTVDLHDRMGRIEGQLGAITNALAAAGIPIHGAQTASGQDQATHPAPPAADEDGHAANSQSEPATTTEEDGEHDADSEML